MDADAITGYISSMSDEELNELFAQALAQQYKEQYAAQVSKQMSAMTTEQLANTMDMALPQYTDDECAKYYDEILEFSGSTYEDNLIKLGCIDLDSPASINLYASSFANKEVIEDAIAEYNKMLTIFQKSNIPTMSDL